MADIPIYLFEATAIDADSLTATTYYFASHPGYNHSSAPGYYVPALKTPANIERHAFASGATFGASQPFTLGAVQIINMPADLYSAGRYDGLIDQGFDGQTARLLMVASKSTDYADAVLLATGTIDEVF